MRYLLIILLLNSILEVEAQDANPLPQWEFTTYPGSLSTNFSDNRYIIKDSLGYIWTYNPSSIERFDGSKFKSYFTSDDFNSDNDVRYVHRMYCDENGKVYALSTAGLSVLNRITDKFEKMMDDFTPYQENLMPEFTCMVMHDGIFYISAFVGLYTFDPSNKKWTFFDLTPEYEHQNAHQSRKAVWYLSKDNFEPHLINVFGRAIYHQFDTRTSEITKTIKLENLLFQGIHKATQVSKHKFYLSSYGGGVTILNTKKQEYNIIYDESSFYLTDKPFRITHSSCFVNGHYVTTSLRDPISFIDTATNEVKSLKELDNAQYDFTSFDGKKYWSTTFKGLVKIEEKLDENYSINFPSDQHMNTVLPNNSEKLIAIQADWKYLSFYDVVNDKIFHLDNVKECLNLFHDRYEDEFLIEVSNGRFLIYDANKLTLKRELILDSKVNYYNNIITPTQYIFNHFGSLQILDKQGNHERSVEIPEKYYTHQQLTHSWISSFNKNNYIIQNPSYVLMINVENGTYKEYPELRNLVIAASYSFNGTDLFAVKSRNGIVKYTYENERDTFLQQNLEYNLPQYTTYQSILFRDSLIWLRGKDNIKIFNMKSERYIMDKYFPISYYNIYNDLSIAPTGVWTCGKSEMIKISLPTQFTQIENINLLSIETKNEKFLQSDNIQLNPNESSIKFSWSSPYYGDSKSINYYTLLKGRDNRWEEIGEDQEKLYLGLNSGKYTFIVKAVAPGAEILQKELVSFEILPRWYMTWWFLLLLILVFIGSLYAVYKYRLHALVQKNKLDNRISQLELKALKAQLNPHFIFNSLNSIKRLIQKNDNKVAIEYLLLFSSMIRNVLDLSDKKSVTLREELEFSEQYLKMEMLRFSKNFEFEIYNGNEDFLDEYSLPTMILQPHLENAIWHGIMPLEDRKGKVLVNIFETEKYVTIRIEDNGIGRAASALINASLRSNIHKSKGQSLSIDRLKLASLSREQQVTTEIIDKDPDGENPGTIVNIKLKK
jgi:hypothetical protein